MANYNKVILVGNLTRDPQLSYTANNMAIAEFGIAVNHRRRTADGQQKEEAMFIDCKVFSKQAEIFCQYMAKGRPVLIEGRLELRQWQSQDGQKRSKHGVIVENFQFLGAGAPDGGPGLRRAPQAAGPQHGMGEEQPSPDYTGPEPVPGPDDDIPF